MSNLIDMYGTDYLPPETRIIGRLMPLDAQRELDAYRALGSVEELRDRLCSPYPDDDGLSPLPWSEIVVD